ncbi:MAG: hypothetical protein WAL20_17815, partial [Rhodomicrobium sp.]
MSTLLRYIKGHQFFDTNGNPLALGNLYYYVAGTATPQDTYSNSAGAITNTNPVVLDGSGRLQVDVYLRSNANYKEVLMASSSVNNVNLSGTALPTPSDSSGSPGGSNGQLQFNNAGAFGGSATTTSANGELVFAGSNKYLQFQPWTPATGPTPAPGFMGYVDYGFYGTSGTLSGVTASTTSGSNTITVNTAAGLAAGNYIAIAGVPYQFIINSISGTTVNVSPAPTATVTNAAVSYVAIDNPAMAYGYNVGHINPSEPEWAKRHEADYLDVDGYRKCETYDEFKPVGVAGAGLRPYFAQVNRDLGNIEFVELFGGRNGVIFYGADGYSTTQVNTGEIFYRGGTTYLIVGTSSLLPGPYQTNLRNATVIGSTTVNSAIVSNAGNLLHVGVKDGSGNPFAEIYSQNISSGATPIPLYLQWGGGNIVFSSTAGAAEGQASSLGSTPIAGTQKFTFGG